MRNLDVKMKKRLRLRVPQEHGLFVGIKVKSSLARLERRKKLLAARLNVDFIWLASGHQILQHIFQGFLREIAPVDKDGVIDFGQGSSRSRRL